MLRPSRAVLAGSCLMLAFAPRALLAQDEAEVELDPVILIAAPTEAQGQSRIEAKVMETRHQGDGLPGMLRGLAGVTTQGGFAEDAETAINIRGLQDFGRVAVTLDGMRQNFARSGHGANGSFALDPEMLREVTVTRGPGAAAGAIAGAVALRSVSVDDLLEEGETSGGELRLRYGDLTASPTLHSAMAFRFGARTDLTLAATRSEKSDYRAADGTEVRAHQSLNGHLATLGVNLDAGRLSVSLGGQSRTYVTGRDSSTPRSNDLTTRNLGLGWHSDDLAGWELDGKLYQTNTSLDQTALTTGVARSYDTTTDGVLVTANRTIGDHALSLRLEAFSDSVTTDDPTASSLTPSGQRDIWSFSLQDRFEIAAAQLTLGLSADHYRLTSTAGNTTGAALSPRLALAWPLSETLTFNAAAALAWRPPSLNETLVDGTHPEPADFPVRPNPQLEPERATNLEIGFQYENQSVIREDDSLNLRATLFRNHVSDYIGLAWQGGVFDGYFQYANIERVRIEGIELEAAYETGPIFLTLAGQHMTGISLETGDDLSRLMPDRLTLTAGHRGGSHEVGLRFTHSAAKTTGDYATGSWKTLDLFLTKALTEEASLGLALNNILDEAYTPHLEIRPAPGFNAQASLTLRF
ncbi:MAG: TonB-dependent receptor [Gemmobacter sp.]|uniref:TonB-dependent receptor domain-containing protein n=1 Tax=Gemmobacter sp. TaxID=1898957 RepID=UPI001A40A091|nr:TonB-dependent receptor [Gemmobacter sp.]MBL8562832.1 TonB-dependent receptor [Gemmobacter sp.]